MESTQDRTPFTEFILKLNSECNLACSYCYMYESVDPISRGVSRTMGKATTAQVGRRIAEHAKSHGITRVRVVLHGGEPLLCGVESLCWAVDELRRQVAPHATVDVVMQTNGVLLTQLTLDRLARAGVGIGVSLDGGRATNDRHRLFRSGRSSYDRVIEALKLLQHSPDVFRGILTVIDVCSDPVETYDALLSHRPPAIDFLLPHGNWQTPPPHRPADQSTPYADWLIAIFERWYRAPQMPTRVRLFQEVVNGLLGGRTQTESVGLSPVGMIVVDTDGSMEHVDALRSAFPGARETQLNVFDHPFEMALSHDMVIARQSGAKGLSDTCLDCPVVRVCGGGYFPHRYSSANGFRNPSVYCADLRRLIEHMHGVVSADVQRIARQASHENARGRR